MTSDQPDKGLQIILKKLAQMLKIMNIIFFFTLEKDWKLALRAAVDFENCSKNKYEVYLCTFDVEIN